MEFFILFLVLLILFPLIPYLFFYFKLENPKNIKKPSYGSFAKLSNGKIFYELIEPQSPNGEIILLVHGFSTPSIVWKGITPFLLEKGFKVLAYDHYGRGYSSRPKIKYTKEFYLKTITELLNYLNIEQKIHLVGYSMGGPIVGYYADENPKSVSSVNFIAPAGYMFESKTDTNLYLKILNIPGVSQYISVVMPSLMYGGNSSIELSSKEDKNRLSQLDLNNVYREQMKYEGFTRSLLSTAKHFNLFNSKKMYQNLGTKKISASVIWGSVDEIVPVDGLKSLITDIPSINHKVIENGFHDITYALPSKVGPFLAEQITDFSND